jgi:hypothetical protein
MKVKVFKNYNSFRKAVADRIHKSKHWLITGYMVSLGYMVKESIEGGFNVSVTYRLKPEVILTAEDVEKVVQEMSK